MAHEHLRAWRQHAGLTQERVAELLGMGHSAIQKWESGAVPVSLPRLDQLAAIYGAESAFQLLFPPSDREAAAKLGHVWDVLRRLSAEDAAAWLHMGERLASAPEGGGETPSGGAPRAAAA